MKPISCPILESINDNFSIELMFDMSFLSKFVDEVDGTIKQTHEFRQLIKNYKLATSKFSKSAE